MSRRRPTGLPAKQVGWVYLLHLDPAYPPNPGPGGQQALHYSGWTADLAARLAEHARGEGARLMEVQKKAGGSFRLAAVERGTRDLEIQGKYSGATRRCPICKALKAGLPPPPPIRLDDLLNFPAPEPRPIIRRAPRARPVPDADLDGASSPVTQCAALDFPEANPLPPGSPPWLALPAAAQTNGRPARAARSRAR